jgi:RNA polymerase sigma factor (sigma-70 family)
MDDAPAPEDLPVGDGFDALFRTEFTPIARSVYLVVGDRRVAEEITQEAFAKAWSRWRRVAHLDRPGAWVQKTAFRMALRDKSRGRRGAELEAQAFGTQPAHDADTSTIAIVELLRSLSPMQRGVVALGILADLPVDDVADRLGCRPATARVHLHRARTRLAELLEEANDAR